MQYKALLILFITSLLIGCGSSENEDASAPNNEITIEETIEISDTILPPSEAEVVSETETEISTEIYTGMFLDSAVQGLAYVTESQNGTTNELGEFSFKTGESITFSVGNITLPTIDAASILTPLEIFNTEDINDTNVVNLLRLLQSLDIDGDADNGIVLTDSIEQLTQDLMLDINFAADDFELQVAALVAQSGSLNTSLVSSSMAIDHFQLTLDELSGNTISSCTNTHEKVGHSGYFSTLAHNVSGLATIIDDCTIEVTAFSFDGGGPEVFFYGALDHQYASSNAFPLGSKLSGITFNNDKVTLKLPQGTSLDDLTGLSVWCVDFDANFGQMEFTP